MGIHCLAVLKFNHFLASIFSFLAAKIDTLYSVWNKMVKISENVPVGFNWRCAWRISQSGSIWLKKKKKTEVELKINTLKVKHFKSKSNSNVAMLQSDSIEDSLEKLHQNYPKFSYQNSSYPKCYSLTLVKELGLRRNQYLYDQFHTF